MWLLSESKRGRTSGFSGVRSVGGKWITIEFKTIATQLKL